LAEQNGDVRRLIGDLAAAFILFLCFLFGRRVRLSDLPWLDGPIGPRKIGPSFHTSLATAAELDVQQGGELGLLPDCAVLDGDGFDAGRMHPAVRDFYERTCRYHLDVWSQWSPLFWPFGWALITFVSRRMEQLNFPMYPIETARGMTSEVEQLVDRDGRVVYTSWLRRNSGTGMVIYSGLYSSATPPGGGPCVKVVFPVSGGNATVLLRPHVNDDGSLELSSAGKRFGDPGFYRITGMRDGSARIWYVRRFTERFHVYADTDGSVRTDHFLKWSGLPVLHLHYHITETAAVSERDQVASYNTFS
jgi:hypothetical protein